MLTKTLLFVFPLFGGLVACAAPLNAQDTEASDPAEAALTAGGSKRIMDACTVTAIGAAAVDAFGDNNLQHFVGLTVDGAPGATDGVIKYTVTTENDEDGATDRKLVVAQRGSSCTVKSMDPLDGKMPTAHDIQSAYKAVVDDCTVVALDSAAKLAFASGNDLQHLHGFSLDDGDPATSNLLKYSITIGNAEDGDTTFAVSVKEILDLNTGKTTCTVKSAAAKK
jgi:hypothetical protein